MYGGGIIVNPQFTYGTYGWTVSGQGEIAERVSRTNNGFMVAYNRKLPLDSFSQKVLLEKGKFYMFSGNYSLRDFHKDYCTSQFAYVCDYTCKLELFM